MNGINMNAQQNTRIEESVNLLNDDDDYNDYNDYDYDDSGNDDDDNDVVRNVNVLKISSVFTIMLTHTPKKLAGTNIIHVRNLCHS